MGDRTVTDEEVEVIERIASACEGYLQAKDHEWHRDEEVRELRRQERNRAALEVKQALDDYVAQQVRLVLQEEIRNGLIREELRKEGLLGGGGKIGW